MVAPSSDKPATISAITSDVPIPERTSRRGTRSDVQYPFEQLAKGQSFHVSHPDKSVDLVKRLSSSVSAARSRHSVPDIDPTTGQQRMRKNNKGILVPAKRPTVDYRIVAVDKTDPDGPGVRVFRTA